MVIYLFIKLIIIIIKTISFKFIQIYCIHIQLIHFSIIHRLTNRKHFQTHSIRNRRLRKYAIDNFGGSICNVISCVRFYHMIQTDNLKIAFSKWFIRPIFHIVEWRANNTYSCTRRAADIPATSTSKLISHDANMMR